MSDADTAYQIAEQRIARAKETGARVLALSPHFVEDGKQSINNVPELSALDLAEPLLPPFQGSGSSFDFNRSDDIVIGKPYSNRPDP